MSEPNNNSTLLGDALKVELKELIREAVREELAATGQNASVVLLDAEKLAERLSVPVTWIYEQSRLGNIPTHRLGRYIRFDLREVIESLKKKEVSS